MVDMSRYNKLRINPDRYNYDLATNLPLRRTFWRIADKTVLFDNKTYCILAIDRIFTLLISGMVVKLVMSFL